MKTTQSGESTTSTTTIEPGPYCGLDSCGSGTTCATKQGDTALIKQVDETFPPRLSQPEANTWVEPANYGGDECRFMRGGKLSLANYIEVLFVRVLTIVTETCLASVNAPTTVDLWDIEVTSYNFVAFDDKVQTLALSGLYGCTAVIVVSRKGAWMGHFWEWPEFVTEHADSIKFEAQVIDVMESGLPGLDKLQYRNQYAIGDLRNKDDKEKKLGHMFDDVNQPWAIVVAPRQRYEGTDAPLLYPFHVDSIVGRLRSIFPGLERIFPIGYVPMAREDISDDDPDAVLRDDAFATERGKVLIQYQPAPKACEGAEGAPQPVAKWRAWIEAKGKLTK